MGAASYGSRPCIHQRFAAKAPGHSGPLSGLLHDHSGLSVRALGQTRRSITGHQAAHQIMPSSCRNHTCRLPVTTQSVFPELSRITREFRSTSMTSPPSAKLQIWRFGGKPTGISACARAPLPACPSRTCQVPEPLVPWRRCSNVQRPKSQNLFRAGSHASREPLLRLGRAVDLPEAPMIGAWALLTASRQTDWPFALPTG